MGLLDEVYTSIDSLTALENMPAVVDTAKVDDTKISSPLKSGPPVDPGLSIPSKHIMYQSGLESIDTYFDSLSTQTESVISELDKRSKSLNKIAQYGFNVSGKQKDLKNIKEDAIENLDKLHDNEMSAKFNLDRKLFGRLGKSGYIPGRSISAEELSDLAIEMDVDPNILADMIRSLPLQERKKTPSVPDYNKLIKYLQK